MRKTRVCVNTRARVFAAQIDSRYLGPGHTIKANKEAMGSDRRQLLMNAPEMEWLQWVQYHQNVKVTVWCEVSWPVKLKSDEESRDLLGVLTHDSTNSCKYSSVNAQDLLFYIVIFRTSSSFCLFITRYEPAPEIYTDHVRSFPFSSTLGGAPLRVHYRHYRLGVVTHLFSPPRSVCISQIPRDPSSSILVIH